MIISSEGGCSTLEIPCARLPDAAWYQCTAQNAAGSTATRARLFVESQKSSNQPRAMRFPKPTKVIEPTVEPQPEVIYLRHVERARPQPQRLEEDERVYQAPVFILPLKGSYYSNEWPLLIKLLKLFSNHFNKLNHFLVEIYKIYFYLFNQLN